MTQNDENTTQTPENTTDIEEYRYIPPVEETLPLRQAAQTILQTTAAFDDTLDADAMVDQLKCALLTSDANSTHYPESVLLTQSRVLDSVFHQVLQVIYKDVNAADDGKDDEQSRNLKLFLALQTQRQCRQSLEAFTRLAELKDKQNQRSNHFFKKSRKTKR